MGSNDDWDYSVYQTTDGGYIIAGYTFSNDVQVSGNHAEEDYWIVKLIPINNLLSLLSTNGSEIWLIGSEQDITWNYLVVTTVNIEYSADNGNIWKNIISNYPTMSGFYTWPFVPNSPSNECLVRILDTFNPLIGDTSDATFSIALIDTTAPSKVRKLIAYCNSPNTIDLNWAINPEPDIWKYRIFRSVNDTQI